MRRRVLKSTAGRPRDTPERYAVHLWARNFGVKIAVQVERSGGSRLLP
jgi:hypothetical protein